MVSDVYAVFIIQILNNINVNVLTRQGGPLFEGQIEDYNGSCHVMCPWHAYMFNLKTGKNELGIEVKIVLFSLRRIMTLLDWEGGLQSGQTVT